MSSATVDSTNRTRKNAVDVLTFAVAIALSVLAVLELGIYGLAAGCILLSGAAALVVWREAGVTPEEDARTAGALATEGVRRDD